MPDNSSGERTLVVLSGTLRTSTLVGAVLLVGDFELSPIDFLRVTAFGVSLPAAPPDVAGVAAAAALSVWSAFAFLGLIHTFSPGARAAPRAVNFDEGSADLWPPPAAALGLPAAGFSLLIVLLLRSTWSWLSFSAEFEGAAFRPRMDSVFGEKNVFQLNFPNCNPISAYL